MKKKTIKQGVVLTLSACMIANTVPLSNFAVQAAAAQELIEFTNESSRGGWKHVQGNGTIGFHDGTGEAGYMTVSSDGHTFFEYGNAQTRKDGFVEMDLTMTKGANGGRLYFLFRYNSPTDWEGVGFDNGNWVWEKGSTWNSLTSTTKTFENSELNTKHHIRLEYRGKHITIYQDNQKIIDQEIAAFDANKTGKIGFRVWGIKNENYDCEFKVDNVKTGDLQAAPTITPGSTSLDQANVGKEDVVVTLGDQNGTLSEIKNGNTVLQKDTDYTVNNKTVTIKKSYLEKIKNEANTDLVFKFEDGQTVTFNIKVNIPEQKISYTRDFAKDGATKFEKKQGGGSMALENGKMKMTDDGIFVDENSKSLKNQEVEFLFNPTSYNCNYGVILRYNSPSDYIYVGPNGQNKQHYTSWGIFGPNGQPIGGAKEDAGFILAGRETPYKVKVRVVEDVVTIFVDNEEIYNGKINGITMKPGKVGFRTRGGNGMIVQKFTQENASAPKVVAQTTPHKIASDKLEVNVDANFPRVIDYTLKDGNKKVTGQENAIHQIELNNKLYTPTVTAEFAANKATYHVSEAETGISFDAVMEVTGNVLSMKIQNVKEPKDKLYTLNFPQHSLVSMSSNDPGAVLTTNDYRAREKSTNLANASAATAYSETTLAVLSNNNVAAALSGQSYKNRHEVAYQTFAAGDHTSTGLWLNEYTYRGLDGKVMIDEPWVKVSVTGDRNKDGKVDVQDGAIALRDDCMKRKVGADVVTDTWTMIAMNVGSEAQYPFLRILDNVKKMSLATDGFGQHIIIKGYQSEGHDASHPDFANYNKRAGGLDDFKTLLTEAKNYNAKIGIHVNHTDVYPEAPQFEKIASKDAPAWDWYDTAKMIIRENDDLDTSEKGFDARMKKLYETDTNKLIDTTYVDVFFGTRWPMYKLVDNIAGRGVVLGTENSDEMVSYSVFAHGVQTNDADRLKTPKNLIRFVENNQSDIFQKTPLFRGVNNRNNDSSAKGSAGINGWQSSSENSNPASLYESLHTFYCDVLPSKFLAQYPLMQYESNNKAVLGTKNEVVTEMRGGTNVITLDGQEVANGNKIFIPWEKDGVKDGKVYHYNENGGSSTWKLPKSWGNVSEVKIYKLSAKGKEAAQTLKVNGNREVTIQADKRTGYVIYKDEATTIPTAATMDWSTGSPVKDMGFDSYGFKVWKPSAADNNTEHIKIKDNNLGNAHLYFEGTKAGKVTQTLTGLVPGQTYSASVWCTTSDGRKATIEVNNGGEIVSNYMDRSNVKYGVHHNDKYKSYAQRMQVRFTAKADTAVLTLEAAKGADANSKVDFDDVRVMKVNPSTNIKPDKYAYWEDFENVDQGYGVFVSPESDQSHLSQRNPENPEHTPDVITGTYSLKVRAGDYMRTIPATVRLEPNKTYTVGLDYKSPHRNSFTFAVKSDKAREAGDSANAVLASEVARDTEGKLVLKFTTGDYDDYYVDITKSAATEYYVDNFYVEAARMINRETLGQLIEEAKKLEASAYTPESFKKMEAELKAAEAVQKNAQSTKEQIKDAYTKLETAISELQAYATAADKKALQDVITEMKSVWESDYVADASWIAFKDAIKKAEGVYASEKATQAQVTQSIRDMRAAKDALNPKVDRTALKEIMAKAERVNRDSIVDGKDLGTFLSELSGAKATDLKQGVTADEIQKAVDGLTAAYNKIVLKDDHKNVLVAEALEKANGANEKYFFEKDWAAIVDAKAKLNAMQSKQGVLVKDYFEALDKLDAALANKTNKPVVPSSMEVKVDKNKVQANTEHMDKQVEGPVKYAFDNDPNTRWHSAWDEGSYRKFNVSANNPATVTVDLGKEYNLNQFAYLQRPANSGKNGAIKKYKLEVFTNGAWKTVVADGRFDVQQGTVSLQKVTFDPVKASKVKISVTEGEGGFATAAEFKFYQKTSDFAALQTLMSEVDKFDKAAYKDAYVADLNKAYADAEKLLENPLTAQATIDAAKAKLEAAFNTVKTLAKKASMELLLSEIATSEKVDVKKYENTAEFTKALKAAQAVKAKWNDNNARVTEKEVNDALVKLSAEREALKLKPGVVDKTALNAAVEKYSSYKEADYTKETWEAFKDALNAAVAVQKNDKATAEDVKNALDALDNAAAALKKNEPTEPGKPVDPDQGGDNQSGNNQGGSNQGGNNQGGNNQGGNNQGGTKPQAGKPQTGDPMTAIPATAGMLVALSAIVEKLRRKKK